jgi:hypothetical protein
LDRFFLKCCASTLDGFEYAVAGFSYRGKVVLNPSHMDRGAAEKPTVKLASKHRVDIQIHFLSTLASVLLAD